MSTKSRYERNCSRILFSVKCQHDFEHVVKYQCSWFVFSVCEELRKRDWKISERDIVELKKIHQQSLSRATKLRKKRGIHGWGESIYSKEIVKYFHKVLVSHPRLTEINPKRKSEDDSVLSSYPEMEDYFKFKNSLPRADIKEFLGTIWKLGEKRMFLLINREYESFLLFPNLKSTEKLEFFIFDSHYRKFGIFALDEVQRYLVRDKELNIDFRWMKGWMKVRTEPISEEELGKHFF